MYAKIEKGLKIAALVSVIFASWALGLNQWASFVSAGKAGAVQQAEAACLEFGAIHAKIIEDTVYCYKTGMMGEVIEPLEKLQELYSK